MTKLFSESLLALAVLIGSYSVTLPGADNASQDAAQVELVAESGCAFNKSRIYVTRP